MAANQVSESRAQLNVRNVGGIDETEVTIPRGVSVLTGRNATNRTSLLEALTAGLGSERASLKGDADRGSVTLELDGETYTRILERQGETVVFDGEPYLEDPELADLFAFLLGDNEARRTVTRGDDLREIIMRPVDTDRINAEIESCNRKRQELEDEVERLDEVEQELPELEAERRDKQSDLEATREDLSAVRSEIADLDTGVEQSRSRKQELEAAFQQVRDARSELDDLEFDLETERSTLSELESEREELERRLSEVELPDEDPEQLGDRIKVLRGRKRSLDDTISDLGSVISFNEEMLDGEDLFVDETRSEGDPTDALIAEPEITCWTCGSEVATDQIEGNLDRLRSLRSEKLDERSEIQSEITDLSERRSELRNRRQERERDEEQLAEVEAEIETTREHIEELEERIETQRADIEELEAEAEAIEVEGHEETLELHRRSNKLELQVERLESDIEELDDEISDRQEAIEARAELETEREELTERLTELRTRVERLEKETVETFNDHMETVLDILEYDNLARIWIERRDETVREGRRKVSKTQFELHIVRAAAGGSVYEDTIEHLSESEREVTGLIFALAGYLVHEVYENVPFVLLDSLEAIDSERILEVIEYFQTHAEYLVAALLPEDAEALPDEYTYITDFD